MAGTVATELAKTDCSHAMDKAIETIHSAWIAKPMGIVSASDYATTV